MFIGLIWLSIVLTMLRNHLFHTEGEFFEQVSDCELTKKMCPMELAACNYSYCVHFKEYIITHITSR